MSKPKTERPTPEPPPPLTAAEIKARILGAIDQRIEQVETPEWAEAGLPTVHVRNLTLAEAAKLQATEDEADAQLLAVGLALCTEGGDSLAFTDAELTLLRERSAGPMRRIHDKTYDLSFLTVGSTEDVAKN